MWPILLTLRSDIRLKCVRKILIAVKHEIDDYFSTLSPVGIRRFVHIFNMKKNAKYYCSSSSINNNFLTCLTRGEASSIILFLRLTAIL